MASQESSPPDRPQAVATSAPAEPVSPASPDDSCHLELSAAWIALTHVAGLRTGRFKFPPGRWAERPPMIWKAVEGGLRPDQRASGRRKSLSRLRSRALDLIERTHHLGMQLVTWDHPGYPGQLRDLDDPPLVLWTSGAAALLDAPAVAIVGARNASQAALGHAHELGRDLACAGLVVVSGLARGIDGAAHRGALESGHTTAVLGGGLDVVYPPEHRTLATRIAAQGALITEFPPGTPPLPHHFPRRNRIVAGLALGVVVVEAAEASGALITAHAALDQGKEVMVVPGSALGGRNRGGHALIKDGAALVEDAHDVIDVLRFSGRWADEGGGVRQRPPADVPRDAAAEAGSSPDIGTTARRRSRTLAAAAFPVDGWRRGEELDLDELQKVTSLPPVLLLTRLVEWELAGWVARTPDGRFVRN